MNEYRLTRRARACMGCERTFEEGEAIVSAVFAGDEGFSRRDVCESCFSGAPEAFSHWRSRQPADQREAHRLDLDLAREFLCRLVEQADPERRGLVYTLTLLLSRKRRVKIGAGRGTDEGEVLSVRIPRADSDDFEVDVAVPELSEADVAALQAELAVLFGFA
jgi:hypothetical protein